MKVTVVKLSIHCDYDFSQRLPRGAEVAYKYVDEEDKGWHDPHGGVFTEAEQAAFDLVATGRENLVVLGAGTRFAHEIEGRLVATFI